MIITKLIGGLGNQLFQYAAGRRLAYINNTNLKLDLSWYKNVDGGKATSRAYGLGEFNIIAENFASLEEIGRFKKNKIYTILEKLNLYHRDSFTKERQFNLNPEVLNLSDNNYIQGHWQSEKYFKDIEDIIRKEFTLKKSVINEYGKLIDETNSVSIHIRRGDYVTDKKTRDFYETCTLNYYHTAIKKIIDNVISPHFFIFSDDMGWVKDNLIVGYPLIFVSNSQSKDYEELALTSRCKHNIIANSSFSWWGAWLNNNPNKIIIAPQKWFKNPSINTEDLIPESWIKI